MIPHARAIHLCLLLVGGQPLMKGPPSRHVTPVWVGFGPGDAAISEVGKGLGLLKKGKLSGTRPSITAWPSSSALAEAWGTWWDVPVTRACRMSQPAPNCSPFSSLPLPTMLLLASRWLREWMQLAEHLESSRSLWNYSIPGNNVGDLQKGAIDYCDVFAHTDKGTSFSAVVI